MCCQDKPVFIFCGDGHEPLSRVKRFQKPMCRFLLREPDYAHTAITNLPIDRCGLRKAMLFPNRRPLRSAIVCT